MGAVPSPPPLPASPTIQQASLNALASVVETVSAGRTLMFVGSGVSIDNEGTDARMLMGALLLRLTAFREVLCVSRAVLGVTAATDAMDQIWKSFAGFLWMKPSAIAAAAADDVLVASSLSGMADQYYEVNEWFCEAFGELIKALDGVTDTTVGLLSVLVAVEERRLSATLHAKLAGGTITLGNPQRLSLAFYVGFAHALCAMKHEGVQPYTTAGKALFLDTLGFAGSDIMGGEPGGTDRTMVRNSYLRGGGADRLLPRQHALARLAREGLLPVLLTTNFDTLVEGAYRLNGFRANDPACLEEGPTVYVITQRRQYFDWGAGPDGARVLKIHGCVRGYGKVRASAEPDLRLLCGSPAGAPVLDSQRESARQMRRALAAIVYTYREIQHWRDDAWSRDLLRSLIRTHDVVFMGYSARDPVIHDTFRSVYEEMGRAGGPRSTRETCAYFFEASSAPGESPSFHSGALLRQARLAAGQDHAALVEDPHRIHLPFRLPGGAVTADYDVMLRWLYHGVVRRLQRRALETHLDTVYRMIQGTPAPLLDRDRLLAAFDGLVAREKADVDRQAATATWNAVGVAVTRHTAWTWTFHPKLLALAERVRRWARGVVPPDAFVAYTEQPATTAWFAVVELAIHALAAGAPTGASVYEPALTATAIVPTMAPGATAPVVNLLAFVAAGLTVAPSRAITGYTVHTMVLSATASRGGARSADRILLDLALGAGSSLPALARRSLSLV